MEQEFHPEEVFQSLLNDFEQATATNDAQRLNQFLNDKRVVLFKEDKKRYLTLRELRAKGYSLFGDFDFADREYKMALPYCKQEYKPALLLNHSLIHFFRFTIAKETSEKRAAMERVVAILNSAHNFLPKGDTPEYDRLTITNVQAFALGYLGKAEEAQKAYQACEFKPVPIPTYNDKNRLLPLFSHYFKGLAFAIEQKNYQLLRNLLMVISIDDETLYGEKNLFKLLQEIMNQTFDMRSEFEQDFNSLFKLAPKLEPAYPNFRYFIDLIGANMHTALELYFAEWQK